MRTGILRTAVLATVAVVAVAGLRRVGPTLAEHMRKCHEMMARGTFQDHPSESCQCTAPAQAS